MAKQDDKCKTKWNESDRLAALHGYEILDTPAEADFDDIVKLAAQICNVPISLISLVEQDRQWFKAKTGIDADQTPINLSICAHAIMQEDVFVVGNTTLDPRFNRNPLVTGEPNLRFYAGAVLETKDKLPIGMLCVLDTEPRTLSESQIQMLQTLARQVMIQLDLRKALKHKNESEERLRFLSRIEDATRDLNDPADIMRVTNSMLGQHMGVSRCAYADLDSDNDTFTIRYNYISEGSPSIAGSHSLDLFGERAAAHMRGGRIFAANDITQELAGTIGAEMFARIGVNAIVCCPLVKEGRLKAMMAVHRANSYVWSGAEIELLKTVAERCWAHIERSRIQTELVDSEKQFRQLADSIPQLAWMADETGSVFWYNQRWYDYTGCSLAEMRGWGWQTVHDTVELSRMLVLWKHALATGEEFSDTFPLRRHDGAMRWHLTRALPIKNAEGKIVRWFGTNTDITEQREARKIAEDANMAKTDFLANMSHEIRTPMNAIMGLSHILALSKPLTSKQLDYIKTLQMSADSLLALINDLLDIAKIEARTVELEQIPFSVSQLMQEVISMMAMRVKEKGLTFTSDSRSIENRMFIGDPTRLRQIVLNLCSNAIKFTDAGNVHVAINCTPTAKAGIEKISISVRDSGIGIAADKLKTIFQKFMQADSSISRRFGGTGLGLAITKTLAEVMGGTINVKSTIGKGSEFEVQIPLEVADEQVDATAAINVSAPQQTPIEKKVQAQILLVEDYEPNVLVASTFLEYFGYAIDVATNGLEAIEKVKSGQYVAVLMDVQMHGMNGFEATDHIRKYEKKNKLPRMPIIGMTAHALAGDRTRCIAAGMDEYISKPFNPDHLEQIIKNVIDVDA